MESMWILPSPFSGGPGPLGQPRQQGRSVLTDSEVSGSLQGLDKAEQLGTLAHSPFTAGPETLYPLWKRRGPPVNTLLNTLGFSQHSIHAAQHE